MRETCAPPKERLSSRPPYSRANGTPWATHWSMMLTDDLGEPVDVGLARAEVAALDRVVEQPVDAVAVVLVVLGGVDAALRGDRVRAARAVLEAEGLDVVAQLGQGRGGRRAGQAGADDDHRDLRLFAGLTSLASNLRVSQRSSIGPVGAFVVDDRIAHRVVGGHLGLRLSLADPSEQHRDTGRIKNPAVITTATATSGDG